MSLESLSTTTVESRYIIKEKRVEEEASWIDCPFVARRRRIEERTRKEREQRAEYVLLLFIS